MATVDRGARHPVTPRGLSRHLLPLVSWHTHLLVHGARPSAWHLSACPQPRPRCLLLTTWEDSSPQGAPVRCVLAAGPRQLAKEGRKCSKYSPSSNSTGAGGGAERPFYSASSPALCCGGMGVGGGVEGGEPGKRPSIRPSVCMRMVLWEPHSSRS